VKICKPVLSWFVLCTCISVSVSLLISSLYFYSTDEEAKPLSILWREDGDKLYMPLEYHDNEFFGERHLRRSPRLISATKNNGSDKYMNKFLGDVFNKNHLTSPRPSSSLTQADNIKLDSSFVGLSKSDEHPSKMIITSSGKSDPDENCLRQSPKTSLFGAENGKREYSLIELSESDEKQPPKKFKTPASLEYKQKKYKNRSSFIGDPILDDEARERWRWRYEMKVITQLWFDLKFINYFYLTFSL
jgi:hypothetical protein